MKRNPSVLKECTGEFLGIFLMVLFGCGAVAVAVLFGAHQGLLPIALVWGPGVTLAIYMSRQLSCAHLNPAVSLAMALAALVFVKLLEPQMRVAKVKCCE